MPYTHYAGQPYVPADGARIDIDGEVWEFSDQTGQWFCIEGWEGRTLGFPASAYDFIEIR